MMFKPIQTLLVFMVCMGFISCEKKCPGYTTSKFRGPIEDYFGAYKPGNWWVYENATKDKRDSIYLLDFDEQLIKNKTICEYFSERTYSLINSYLMNGDTLFVVGDAYTNYISLNFSLVKFQAQTGGFPQFGYHEASDSLWVSPYNDNIGIRQMRNYVLNGHAYENVLQGNYKDYQYFFAKNIGLVGWRKNKEIFNLIDYHLN